MPMMAPMGKKYATSTHSRNDEPGGGAEEGQGSAESGVFDRRAMRRHRDRAANLVDGHDFLFNEIAARLIDRLSDITRALPVALDLSCHSGALGALLRETQRISPQKIMPGGITTLVQADPSP